MGGGSLERGPPLVKRDSDYRFLPFSKRGVDTHLSGYVVLSGFVVFGNWVCNSEWVCGFGVKILDSFDKFDVFVKKVTTTFSLGYQRKVYLFVICHFFLLNKINNKYIYNITPPHF